MIHALDADIGTQRWTWDLGAVRAVTADMVYVTDQETLHALDPNESGRDVRWTYSADDFDPGRVVPVDDVLFVQNGQSDLLALAPADD
jgi:outer membrane protein assembly factor BamB